MASWQALHYNKIAKMLRERRTGLPSNDQEVAVENLLNSLTLEFVEYFKKDNELFDERKFVEACGFKGE